MKYTIGQEFYYTNREGELIPTKIIGIKFEFNRRAAGQTSYLRESEIDANIKAGKLFLGTMSKKELEIKRLEQKYGIKLVEKVGETK